MTAATKLYYTRAKRRANVDARPMTDGISADPADQQEAKVPAGLVEVYASEAARDGAIGAAGRDFEFVACDAREAFSEDETPELAIGHVAGEEGFEAVLAFVADRLAPLLVQAGPHRVIANRIAYAVDNDGRPMGAKALIPGWKPSEAIVIATNCGIWRALGERVVVSPLEATSRATSRRKNARG